MKLNISIIQLLFIALFGTATVASAQLNPVSSMYFQNRYLANPAMAGTDPALKINLGFRKQWYSFPGEPQSHAFTADYGFRRVGIGVNLYTDKSGLQTSSRAVGSYAYHLPIGDKEQLNFGISLGFAKDRIDMDRVDIDNSEDPVIGSYNEQKTYIDGDFGLAFLSKSLTLQAAIPNIKAVLNRDQVGQADQAKLFASAGYKFLLGQWKTAVELEPVIAYRSFRGMTPVYDVALNANFQSTGLFATGIYRSSGSATLGAGIKIGMASVTGMYTYESYNFSGLGNGTFEINLSLALFERKADRP